ncbi:Uncharacterised protein [uncultured archaeon]|nr:Uncharacterised protein [uncultured archaeon]
MGIAGKTRDKILISLCGLISCQKLIRPNTIFQARCILNQSQSLALAQCPAQTCRVTP